MASATPVYSSPLPTACPPLPITRAQSKPQISSSSNINSLKSCKNLQQTLQLHANFTKQGLLHKPTKLANLIANYSQIGSPESLQYAQKAFTMFKNISKSGGNSTTYVYNSMIRGNSLAGYFRNAILLYIDMLSEGVEPDNYTFPFLLSACAKSFELVGGLQLHGSILKMGFQSDVFVSNSLIHLYGECGEVEKGRKVFDGMPERNVVSWTSLICGYTRRNLCSESVSLFFGMVDEGIEPTEVALVSVITACAKLGDPGLGERVADYVVGRSSGKAVNDVMVNALVDMYMKCGAVDKGKQLFDECRDKDLVLYNTVISNYGKLGKVKQALHACNEMLHVGLKPDRVTILSLLSSAAELGYIGLGAQCHAYVYRHGLEASDTIGNSIISMYSKCGSQELARRVFDQITNKSIVSWNSLLAGLATYGDLELMRRTFSEMPERNLVSWNTLISALAQHSFFEEAIEQFRSMQNTGMKADKVTMVSVASACGYLGDMDLAKWTYDYIKKYGIECDMHLGTALIDMFARCGDPQSALAVFSTMKDRDVSAWTAVIGAMAVGENGERALELFEEMIRDNVLPDEAVFAQLLTACSYAGLVEQGMRVFHDMKDHGVTPNIVHYGCTVNLLGRAGLLNEALNFIHSMPMEPNTAIWSAFRSACRVHKNEELASLAADMIIKYDDN